MTIYHNLMQQIEDAGLLFNVQKANLLAEVQDSQLHGRDGCKLVDNRKALINSKTGKIMSIVSNNYKVVTNEEIFSSFCKNIEASNIDAEGATVAIQQTSTGSRAMVDFTFPAHQVSILGDSSPTALQFCALNSFDGSTRYITKAGGLRMKCLNGQIVGNVIGAYSSLHTKSLDVDRGTEIIIKMLQDFHASKDYWSRMLQIPINNGLAHGVIVDFLGIKEVTGAPAQPIRNNRRFNHLVKLWHEYTSEFGSNAYALYNALTDFISHPMYEYRQTGPNSYAAKTPKEPTKTAISQRVKLRKLLNSRHPFSRAKSQQLVAA